MNVPLPILIFENTANKTTRTMNRILFGRILNRKRNDILTECFICTIRFRQCKVLLHNGNIVIITQVNHCLSRDAVKLILSRRRNDSTILDDEEISWVASRDEAVRVQHQSFICTGVMRLHESVLFNIYIYIYIYICRIWWWQWILTLTSLFIIDCVSRENAMNECFNHYYYHYHYYYYWCFEKTW